MKRPRFSAGPIRVAAPGGGQRSGLATPRVGRFPGSHEAFGRCTGPAPPTSKTTPLSTSPRTAAAAPIMSRHTSSSARSSNSPRGSVSRDPPDAHGEANLNLGTSQSVCCQLSFPLLSTSALIQVMPVIGRSCRCERLRQLHCATTAIYASRERQSSSWSQGRTRGKRAGPPALVQAGSVLPCSGCPAVPFEVPYRASLPGGSCGTPDHRYAR